ncbi:AraC family transcriptional regulator [Bacillus sp. FJAT-50079]|uniref:helix-turn-helix transcriptional regulator n=1 Tax=Bacillus sp. FJAT-50079 TaxID=2833577 RepID=UPI001BC8F1A0|nr:AraC family transcriptional regulator [Bacillus sp. FJAT-50079]MBS4207992.1 helix-turn-helix transcriptional regulator [Bacillus sp. FJAT-50079]
MDKQTIIEDGHRFRDRLLHAIKSGDRAKMDHFIGKMDQMMKDDSFDLLKRTPGNRLRSYKNFLLSHNTLYGHYAGKGGLSAPQSHYMTEKYAILIEHSDTISQLEQLHLNMLHDYSDSTIRIKTNENTSIVEKAENYIEMNFAEDISIEEIARNIHVHPSHLMRVFKKEKGITISHFRSKRRIKEAKQLLTYSTLSMTEIAMIVGFSSPQYFSRIFKREEGVTPLEFKRKH